MDHKEQKEICEKYNSTYTESSPHLKIGISKNIHDEIWPINGLRHNLEGDTTGWYIWRGEYSFEDDFFVPLHVSHLDETCPLVVKYLGLAPGWRFLITDGYEDV